ncbi:MAG: hypothetical protein GTO02_12580 [Candidatus Dadabacteria bacterium]|nr:hypothetical protein [Candidatus Dadabacteria bacterium]NIQ15186.1 hypothetical protein [Candidatus Dadabacteria bacterium]
MITLNGINKNDIGDLQKLKTVYLNMENNDSKITIRRKTNKVDQLIKTIRNYN